LKSAEVNVQKSVEDFIWGCL